MAVLPLVRARIRDDRRTDVRDIDGAHAVLDGPEVPIVDDRAGQQDADAPGQRTSGPRTTTPSDGSIPWWR